MFNWAASGCDIETCERCAGQVKIIVEASNRCIEDPAVIERILAHLKKVVLVNTEPVTLYKAAKLARENNVDAFAMVEASGPMYRRFTFRVTLGTARLRLVTGAGKVLYDKTTVVNSSIRKVIGSQSQLSNNDIVNMLGEAVAADLEQAMGASQGATARSTYNNASYSQGAVKRAQQCLSVRGYSPGVADGFTGRKTENALRQFQSDQSLESNGSLNEDTIALLDQLCGNLAITGLPVPDATSNSLTPANTGFTRTPGRANSVESQNEVTSHKPSGYSGSATIIRGPAEVYNEPSSLGDILTVLPNGSQIKIITIRGDWVEIKAGSNVGYLYKDLTDLVK